jgi:DNA replication and repair protein RecF
MRTHHSSPVTHYSNDRRSLRLRNFRNYAAQEIQLPAGLIALTGDNGQGKTNLLEALCVLATTKSPLVERDRELMRWEQNETRLAAEVELCAGRTSTRVLEYGWRLDGSTVTRDMRAGGVPQSALASWLGQLQIVAFFRTIWSSSLANRASAALSQSRIGKSRPAHFADAARYRRALQQRNALLSTDGKPFQRSRADGQRRRRFGYTLEWNKQLITYGSPHLGAASAVSARMAPILAEVHGDLSGRDEFSQFNTPQGGARDTDVFEYSNEHWTRLFQNAL